MVIPEILKGSPHLPLTEHMSSVEAIGLVNAFYQTTLDPKDFKDTQVFKTPEDRLVLELLDKTSGKVIATFSNQASAQTETPTSKLLWNPVEKVSDEHNWLTAPVILTSPEEIAFLDELGERGLYPITSSNTLAWDLRNLLHGYNVLGRWSAGTYGPLCTAGFELIYKGPSNKAPKEFLVGESPMLAIIQLHHGETKGYLCLKT